MSVPAESKVYRFELSWQSDDFPLSYIEQALKKDDPGLQFLSTIYDKCEDDSLLFLDFRAKKEQPHSELICDESGDTPEQKQNPKTRDQHEYGYQILACFKKFPEQSNSLTLFFKHNFPKAQSAANFLVNCLLKDKPDSGLKANKILEDINEFERNLKSISQIKFEGEICPLFLNLYDELNEALLGYNNELNYQLILKPQKTTRDLLKGKNTKKIYQLAKKNNLKLKLTGHTAENIERILNMDEFESKYTLRIEEDDHGFHNLDSFVKQVMENIIDKK